MLVLGTNIAVLLDCSKSSRQCSLPSLLTYGVEEDSFSLFFSLFVRCTSTRSIDRTTNPIRVYEYTSSIVIVQPMKNTDDVPRLSSYLLESDRALTEERAEVKLVTCAQLSEAGS